MRISDALTDKVISRSVGEELRRRREELGWSREDLVGRLPSGIGERTLLAYEHGTRHMTVLRLIELCRALSTSAPDVLRRALQRTQIHLANLPLLVDLQHLLQDENMTFHPLRQWARNRLNDAPNGVAEVSPDAVRELAASIGRTPGDLTTYLARFLPEGDRLSGSEVMSTR